MYRDAPGSNQVQYQQGNMVQSNQSYVAGQMRTGNYPSAMQQGQASYQQHGQVVGMPNQGQQQSQYAINQHQTGRTVPMGRCVLYWASATKTVDSGSILGRVQLKSIKPGIHSFPAWRSALRGTVWSLHRVW